MNIYVIANWITGCFEAFFFYFLFEGFLERRSNISQYLYFVAVIAMAVLIDVSNFLFSVGIVNLVFMMLIGFIASFIYEGKLKFRLLIPALVIMVIIVTEIVTLFALSVLFDKSVNIITANGYMRIVGIAVSKILGYVIIRYITHRLNKELKYINTNYWILFLVVFLSSTLTMCTLCKVLEDGASEYLRRMIIICSCGASITAIVTLYLYERTLKQNDVQQELQQMQLKNQVKHYDELMMSQEQIRKTKHDLKNHLYAIKALIDNEERSPAVAYIHSILEDISGGNVSFNTGNTVLDAILSVKKEDAERKGICFTANLLVPSGLPVTAEDICVIFGNALDNAIEACEKVEKKPYIFVELVYGENTLMCKIENSSPLAIESGRATTKEDVHNHGIGKKNIERALEHYNSVYETESSDDRYVFSFLIMDLDG